MILSSLALPRVLAVAGGLYFAAIMVLVVSKAPLGSPIFYGTAAVAALAYGAVVARIWHEPAASRRLLYIAFAMAVAFRVPPAVAPVGVDSDMVRYLWDGRVQQLGYNPYTVRPDNPALAHTHRNQSAAMPSRHDGTPYPPAAQLFFRFVVSLHDSTLAMKLALVVCDLLTMLVLWRWLHVHRPLGMADAHLRLESAGRARGRAQRPHRRARRAVDGRRRLLARAAADPAGDARLRACGRRRS